MARRSKPHVRRLVAEALLHVGKQKVDLLNESELVDVLSLQPDPTSYWGQGIELSKRLRKAASATLSKLRDQPRFEPHRRLLEAILSGSSIAAYARKRGQARETVSRNTWRQVTELVAQELT